MFTNADVVSRYSRSQAIEDGLLIDISETAREAGIKHPTAITKTAWEEFVEWQKADTQRQRIHQDEGGRLWDVLWMFRCAARARPETDTHGPETMYFPFHCVPRDGRSSRPKLSHLKALCGPGDTDEPVITIMLTKED